MNNKTEAVKVTLRPTQIKKVMRVAKKDYEGNFSLTLRVMIDKFEELRVMIDKFEEEEEGFCYRKDSPFMKLVDEIGVEKAYKKIYGASLEKREKP